MFQALYDFFYSLISDWSSAYDSNFADMEIHLFPYSYISNGQQITQYGWIIQADDYLATIMALIGFVFIFVLCCLFVYKIIKLVGNLIK